MLIAILLYYMLNFPFYMIIVSCIIKYVTESQLKLLKIIR